VGAGMGRSAGGTEPPRALLQARRLLVAMPRRRRARRRGQGHARDHRRAMQRAARDAPLTPRRAGRTWSPHCRNCTPTSRPRGGVPNGRKSRPISSTEQSMPKPCSGFDRSAQVPLPAAAITRARLARATLPPPPTRLELAAGLVGCDRNPAGGLDSRRRQDRNHHSIGLTSWPRKAVALSQNPPSKELKMELIAPSPTAKAPTARSPATSMSTRSRREPSRLV